MGTIAEVEASKEFGIIFSSAKKSEWIVEIPIQGNTLKFRAHTGAGITCISETNYKHLFKDGHNKLPTYNANHLRRSFQVGDKLQKLHTKF